MTLCVAAVCGDDGEDPDGPAIVVAADYQIEQGIAGAEIFQKCTYLNSMKWLSLMAADEIARAEELNRLLDAHLQASTIGRYTAVDTVKEAVYKFQTNLIDEWIHGKFGISYDYYLKEKPYTEQTRQDIETAIPEIKMECELLLGTFFNKKPLLMKIQNTGRVVEQDHFSQAGAGAYIALANFYQREHVRPLSLEQTLYHVYEAMRLGAIAPGVGKKHEISVIRPADNGKLKRWRPSAAGERYLAKLFNKFGPKKMFGKRRVPFDREECLEVVVENPEPPT